MGRPTGLPGDPATVLQLVQHEERYSGPLPRPADLEHYERVHTGLAERIVQMAERQVSMAEAQMGHRHGVEERLTRGMNSRATAGLWIAALLAVGIFIGAFAAIFAGHDAAGTAIATIDVASLVGVFVYGRHDQRRQDDRRLESG